MLICQHFSSSAQLSRWISRILLFKCFFEISLVWFFVCKNNSRSRCVMFTFRSTIFGVCFFWQNLGLFGTIPLRGCARKQKYSEHFKRCFEKSLKILQILPNFANISCGCSYGEAIPPLKQAGSQKYVKFWWKIIDNAYQPRRYLGKSSLLLCSFFSRSSCSPSWTPISLGFKPH